jgi:hypothetical protein
MGEAYTLSRTMNNYFDFPDRSRLDLALAFTVCSGGESIKNCTTCEGRTDPGGGGGRQVIEGDTAVSISGGGGANLELGSGQILVGGGGGHSAPEGRPPPTSVGGSGIHAKGPGGNSD